MMGPSSRTPTPFEKGVTEEMRSVGLNLVGPIFIIFGIYLLVCLWPEYQKLNQAADWTLTRGSLVSVNAPPFNRGRFELDNMLCKSATITYAYEGDGDKFNGGIVLNPQGPRFYYDENEFYKSGDSVAANNLTAKYEKQYKFEPIGGWSKPKTAWQKAAPFRFDSLRPDHYLSIKYDPKRPSVSILDKVMQEHLNRVGIWALSSIVIGLLAIGFNALASYASSQTGSDDRAIESIYDKLNPDTAHLR